MNISALLTSAGLNIGFSTLFLSLYSVLRKQPGNAGVYFGRKLSQEHNPPPDTFTLERLLPSPTWIVKALGFSEEEILAAAGLDGVVFLRIFVFSIRIFSIVALVCVFGVLPLNYYGRAMPHSQFNSESLTVFTISNVEPGSWRLWFHCLALYIITCSACILLHSEYKSISRMRLVHITTSPPNPSHFSVLVRSIPGFKNDSFDKTIKNFFTSYHGSSYLSHQMIYRTGTLQKLVSNAKKIYKKLLPQRVTSFDKKCGSSIFRCGLFGGSNSFQLYHNEFEVDAKKPEHESSDSRKRKKECSAAFVFFKTRYAAVVAAQVLQSSNPMIWVTDLAPEPHDVYWSNLWIPYKQLWFRRITVLIASLIFVFLFLFPVAFVQGLSHLDQLQKMLPFLKGILKKSFMRQLVTGYLPSVILQLFLYIVPPTMMLFSSVEGYISRSGRKKSACRKVLYFNIWNIFFVNALSGSIINALNAISSPKDIPLQIAKAIPSQASFFVTYVLTSGWASLSAELMQFFALICNLVRKIVLRKKDDPNSVPSFPYHTEVPKVLLFGLLGFTHSTVAPIILPFLLVYFFLGYVVYRNQILNVYCTKYETGGQIWPIVHNTTIFSLVASQIIAIGVFVIKESPAPVAFTILLVIITLLFNEYCRQRFSPIFNNLSAQDLIEMDKEDEQSGRMQETHEQLLSAYRRLPSESKTLDLHPGEESAVIETSATNGLKS